jgi:hypothetical protein
VQFQTPRRSNRAGCFVAIIAGHGNRVGSEIGAESRQSPAHQAAIDAAAEQYPDRHIGLQTNGNCIE